MEVADIRTFVEQKKEWMVGSLAVFAGIAILVIYFQSGPSATAYAQAEAAYSKWEAAPQDETLYHQLQESLRKVPSLEKKYEAAMAQKLLNTEKLDEAITLAHRSLARVHDEAPLHSLYARTSLLIEQGDYQQALQDAVSLKEKLLQESSQSLLFAHNLLRIACLQQQLKNRPGEKAAWEELESYLKTSAFADLLLDNFTQKQVDLTQYIASRKKSL
jgi:hypothetical protein